MLQLILVGALLFAVAIAVFAVQNTTQVAVEFLVWRADAIAISVLVLVAATLGGGLAMLLGGAREVQLRLRLRSQAQQLTAAQQRLHTLETSNATAAAAAAADDVATGDEVLAGASATP